MRDKTGVEEIKDQFGESRLKWLGHLEKMNSANLIRKVKEEFQEI